MPSPSTSPTWYDLLGVSHDADEEQIRRAWREATDRFGPGAGRTQFRMYNQAAEVLLDPRRRREYDDSLDADAGPAPSPAPTTAPAEPPVAAPSAPVSTTEPGRKSAGQRVRRKRRAARATSARRPVRRASLPLLALSAVLALLAVAAVVVGVLAYRHQADRDAVAEARSQAPDAAERALPAVLSYDYRTLKADRVRAEGYLTPHYRAQYDRTFKLLETDQSGKPGAAVQTKAVVKANVLGSGVVDASADLVRVLVFVDQTSQKAGQDPQVFQNRVAVTMQRSGHRWLVDNLKSY